MKHVLTDQRIPCYRQRMKFIKRRNNTGHIMSADEIAQENLRRDAEAQEAYRQEQAHAASMSPADRARYERRMNALDSDEGGELHDDEDDRSTRHGSFPTADEDHDERPMGRKNISLTSPDASGLVPYNLQGQAPKSRKGVACAKCSAFNGKRALKCKGCGMQLGSPAAPVAVKGAKDCPACGHGYDADAKMRRCEGCGKKLPKGDMTKAEKRHTMPASVDGASRHREPDAGMHTDSDAVHDRTPASVKGGEAGYVLKRTHDALCAAYDWDAVVDEYPALKSVGEVCDQDWWAGQIPAALSKGDLAGVAFLAGAANVAEALHNTDVGLLGEIRAGVHKSFSDMYPTTTLHPADHITPGQFTRPYLSGGHAPLNATGGVSGNVPPTSHTISPDEFRRGLITEGHESGAPSSQPDNSRLDSVRTGSARALYTSVSKAQADAAMKAMHDHISTTFPEMCPMAPSAPMPSMQENAVPRAYTPPTSQHAPGEKSGTADLLKAVKSAQKAARRAEKAAARSATSYETQIAELSTLVDELGSQPDPAQAPLRGPVSKAAGSGAAPVEKRSMLAEAQDAAVAAEIVEQETYLRLMTKSSDPNRREQAEDLLSALLLTKSA